MKKKRFLAAVMAVALVLLPLCTSTIEASAEEAVTYAVKYVESEGDWRFQANTSEFDDSAYHRELYYLYEQMKDGDIVVVYNDTTGWVPELNLGDKKLSNLTVVSAASTVVVHTGGIDLFFALAGTAVAVNGDVNTASVYDDVICNFNNNVGTLNLYIKGSINSSLAVVGTLGHFYGYHLEEERVYYDFYNFKAGSLAFYDGGFRTPDENFSRTPVTVKNPVSTTTAPAAPSTSGSASSGSDYDDVPKTGESSMAMWLLFTAVLCAGGSYILGKKAQ